MRKRQRTYSPGKSPLPRISLDEYAGLLDDYWEIDPYSTVNEIEEDLMKTFTLPPFKKRRDHIRLQHAVRINNGEGESRAFFEINNNNNNIPVAVSDNILDDLPDITNDDLVPDDEGTDNIIVPATATKTRYGRTYGKQKYARDAFRRPIGNQYDVNYIDIGHQDEVHEDGVIYRTLLDIERDDTGYKRTGNKIYIKRIEFRGEFTLQYGNKGDPRFILWRDKQPATELHNTLSGSYLRVKNLKVDDILSKSPIALSGDIEEGDLPDLEKKPNNNCFYQFNATKSQFSDKIVPMYDFYKELNTKCFSGEDFIATPDSKYFHVTLSDLNIPVTYLNDHGDSINMNNISFLWIGDYQGGTILGTVFFRIWYVNETKRGDF